MVTRLSGGLTPADGTDPRTFPSIWNATASTIETQGSAISTAESDIDTLQSEMDEVQQEKVGVVTAGSDSISVDFSTETPLVSRDVSGTAVTVSGSNYEAGVTRTVRILGGGSDASLSVPGDWVFVGNAVGTSVPAGTAVVISATAFGTAATDVIAAYAEEA